MATRADAGRWGSVLALVLSAAGCGATTDEASSKPTTTAAAVAPATTAKAGAASTLAITGVDYAYKGVPAKVAPGTVVTLTNESTKEVHEVVALRVVDGETRPMAALLQLPEAERDKAAEFRGVTVAFPGEKGFSPQGPLTLTQPGRYLLVCTIPTGADPVAYREKAKTAQGPVVVPGGPPHLVGGMAAELTVG